MAARSPRRTHAAVQHPTLECRVADARPFGRGPDREEWHVIVSARMGIDHRTSRQRIWSCLKQYEPIYICLIRFIVRREERCAEWTGGDAMVVLLLGGGAWSQADAQVGAGGLTGAVPIRAGGRSRAPSSPPPRCHEPVAQFDDGGGRRLRPSRARPGSYNVHVELDRLPAADSRGRRTRHGRNHPPGSPDAARRAQRSR